MELCVVRHKVKTNNGKSCRKTFGQFWYVRFYKKKKCLCFDVCALCLSSTMESSRLYMWRHLVESRWYPTASSAEICHLWTIGFASSNDHLSKLKLPAHNIKNIKIYNIYRGIYIDMWCKSRPSSPIRIVCPCTDATWPNDVCHRYIKFKSVWPCSMCIHYNMLVSKPHRISPLYSCMHGFQTSGSLIQIFEFKFTLIVTSPIQLFFNTHTVVFSL